MNVYFSDFFDVTVENMEEYGAFNISLINDLPVFIDPFLFFNSDKKEYQNLHDDVIKYVTFLRDISEGGEISSGLLKHWFLFPEVKQNWLGFSRVGNGGSGLGKEFASALNSNLATIFTNFGSEKITKGSHLEKLCLIRDGVGRDSISDFTTNIIKGFLCEYTQSFALQYVDPIRLKKISVPRAEFNYTTRSWVGKTYTLPYIDSDYVLLTPKDILTKDEAWINKTDIVGDFDAIIDSVPNDELRGQINYYFLRNIPPSPNKKEVSAAVSTTVRKYPELIDRYIRLKEDNGDEAVSVSDQKIKETESIFIAQVAELVWNLNKESEFYKSKRDTLEEAYNRLIFLKQVLENNDGYKLFYIKGEPVKREADLQLIFRLTWYASDDDVNAEVNNGRGPVDYKISRGSSDSTLVEFKLASNSKLKQNLQNQVEVYKNANATKKTIKVIMFFSDSEFAKVLKIMNELELKEGKELVLIDARKANKPSASNAKQAAALA